MYKLTFLCLRAVRLQSFNQSINQRKFREKYCTFWNAENYLNPYVFCLLQYDQRQPYSYSWLQLDKDRLFFVSTLLMEFANGQTYLVWYNADTVYNHVWNCAKLNFSKWLIKCLKLRCFKQLTAVYLKQLICI